MPTADDIRHALLKGELCEGMTFVEQVWAVCRRIPKGRVCTYGDLAAALGRPRAARAVGMAMNRNPYAPTVPCHRVVGSAGQLTGYAGGLPKKRAMLAEEGIRLLPGDRVDLGHRIPVAELSAGTRAVNSTLL